MANFSLMVGPAAVVEGPGAVAEGATAVEEDAAVVLGGANVVEGVDEQDIRTKLNTRIHARQPISSLIFILFSLYFLSCRFF